MPLSHTQLSTYVSTYAGIRAVSELEPLGGPRDKVFPPTYGVDDSAATKYATELRVVDTADGQTAQVESVVLNSVAAQAHQLAGALRTAWESGELDLPLIGTDFSQVEGLEEYGTITDLDAPHRVYDAINRDSLDGDVPFRFSDIGKAVTEATVGNATALYQHSPSALLFGAWDSTGPKGGRGSKFERAITSEIVATGIALGKKTSSRIDPLGIEKVDGIYRSTDGSWTFDESEAAPKSKPIRPSEINHGNVTPSIDAKAGGITAASIEATTVLSLIQLRRLKFPKTPDGAQLDKSAGDAARTTLAALGLAAVALAFEQGFDLRSRCVLAPTSELVFEAVGRAGEVETFTLTGAEALALVAESAAAAAKAGLPWRSGLHPLTPTDRLVELVRRSRDAAIASAPVEA
jgi:CRISPR-associated protein Csb1